MKCSECSAGAEFFVDDDGAIHITYGYDFDKDRFLCTFCFLWGIKEGNIAYSITMGKFVLFAEKSMKRIDILYALKTIGVEYIKYGDVYFLFSGADPRANARPMECEFKHIILAFYDIETDIQKMLEKLKEDLNIVTNKKLAVFAKYSRKYLIKNKISGHLFCQQNLDNW